jgi:hypothetical protein
MITVGDDAGAIDPDMFDADGQLVWIPECGSICHRVRVEDDDIREHPVA